MPYMVPYRLRPEAAPSPRSQCRTTGVPAPRRVPAVTTDLAVVPAKEREEVAVAVERGELPGTEVRRGHPGTRDVMEHARRLKLGEQGVDIRDLDPAACGAGEEGLRARRDRASVKVLA